MSIGDAFLHEILAHPDDDAPRLIYADWLDEHGDPRGEFIRVQCALAELGEDDPRRLPLEQREQELLGHYEAEWRPQWQAGFDQEMWIPSGFFVQNIEACEFRRGFVDSITLTPATFLVSGEKLFAQAPIRRLHLRTPSSGPPRPEWGNNSWAHLWDSPLLARLHGLSLTHVYLSNAVIQAFAASPYLRQLKELQLSRVSLEEATSFHELPPRHSLSELTTLDVSDTRLPLDALRVLVNSPLLPNVTTLKLNGNRLTDETVAVLAESRLLPQLERLQLDSNLLGDAGALALRDWPRLPRLAHLSLRRNHIFAAGIQALANAPALRDLIALNLMGNIAGDVGAAALAACDWKRLQALNLHFNGVGDVGVRALARAPAFAHLIRLDLTANRITSVGARALAESSALPRLARLDLPRNDIAAPEQQRLRERFGPSVCC